MTEKLRIEITAVRRRITITRSGSPFTNVGGSAEPNEFDQLESDPVFDAEKVLEVANEATRKSGEESRRTGRK